MWKLALIKVRFGSHTSYQDQILGKIIDGVPAKYTRCGSSSPRRMYARSKPESWDSKNNYNNSSHKKGLRGMVDYIRGLKDRYCSVCGSWWTEQEAKQKNPLGTRCPRLDCGSKLRFGPRYRRGRAAVMRVKKRIG